MTRWTATVKLRGPGRRYEFVSERHGTSDGSPGSPVVYSSAHNAAVSAARLIALAETEGRVVVQAYITPERSS